MNPAPGLIECRQMDDPGLSQALVEELDDALLPLLWSRVEPAGGHDVVPWRTRVFLGEADRRGHALPEGGPCEPSDH